MTRRRCTGRCARCRRGNAGVVAVWRGARFAAIVPALSLAACDGVLPTTWKEPPPPAIDSPAGFARLWSANCAGCHGVDGDLGPAAPMRHPLYLASVSDAELSRVISQGSAPGSLMPAFAQSSGGSLSPVEIDAIISGMRRAWGSPDAKASPIPYAANASAPRGDPARGKAAFDRSCASCHGAEGTVGSVTDPFYLQLVSDQALRSAIIFGRADLGMPGAAGPFPDRPPSESLTAQEVDDIVAWLAQRRAQDWPPKSIRRGGQP